MPPRLATLHRSHLLNRRHYRPCSAAVGGDLWCWRWRSVQVAPQSCPALLRNFSGTAPPSEGAAPSQIWKSPKKETDGKTASYGVRSPHILWSFWATVTTAVRGSRVRVTFRLPLSPSLARLGVRQSTSCTSIVVIRADLFATPNVMGASGRCCKRCGVRRNGQRIVEPVVWLFPPGPL
jgi:hypothetical protein